MLFRSPTIVGSAGVPRAFFHAYANVAPHRVGAPGRFRTGVDRPESIHPLPTCVRMRASLPQGGQPDPVVQRRGAMRLSVASVAETCKGRTNAAGPGRCRTSTARTPSARCIRGEPIPRRQRLGAQQSRGREAFRLFFPKNSCREANLASPALRRGRQTKQGRSRPCRARPLFHIGIRAPFPSPHVSA